MTTKAHGASLPLFVLMQQLVNKPMQEGKLEMETLLGQLKLTDDISIFPDQEVLILLPKTEYGVDVLVELKARSAFPPCEAGACEYSSSLYCMWCGKMAK